MEGSPSRHGSTAEETTLLSSVLTVRLRTRWWWHRLAVAAIQITGPATARDWLPGKRALLAGIRESFVGWHSSVSERSRAA
jgi:hypothetical protein